MKENGCAVLRTQTHTLHIALVKCAPPNVRAAEREKNDREAKMKAVLEAKKRAQLQAAQKAQREAQIQAELATIPIGVLVEQERSRYRYAQDTSEPHPVSILYLTKINEVTLLTHPLHSMNFYIVQFQARMFLCQAQNRLSGKNLDIHSLRVAMIS